VFLFQWCIVLQNKNATWDWLCADGSHLSLKTVLTGPGVPPSWYLEETLLYPVHIDRLRACTRSCSFVMRDIETYEMVTRWCSVDFCLKGTWTSASERISCCTLQRRLSRVCDCLLIRDVRETFRDCFCSSNATI